MESTPGLVARRLRRSTATRTQRLECAHVTLRTFATANPWQGRMNLSLWHLLIGSIFDQHNKFCFRRSSTALLKCYDCVGSDCRDEKTCSDSYDACIKNFVGEDDSDKTN